MLLPHIVNLNLAQGTIGQCTLYYQSRIIGMYMDLCNLIICHYHNRIANGFQISLEIYFPVLTQGLIQHNDELRTIPKLNILLRLLGNLGHAAACLYAFQGIVNLFANQGVICPLQHRN